MRPSVESATSSRVFVHHVKVVPVTVRNMVVPPRQAEDRADVGGLGENARLLAEGESAVDRMSAAGVIECGPELVRTPISARCRVCAALPDGDAPLGCGSRETPNPVEPRPPPQLLSQLIGV